LRVIGGFYLAQGFETLSNLVKQMPERRMLTKSIIKNNLIEPYAIILPKMEGIEERVQAYANKFTNSKAS